MKTKNITKKTIVRIFFLTLFVISLNTAYTGQVENHHKKRQKKYYQIIQGTWYAKTYKTIFNIPVYLKATFYENKTFHLNIKVLSWEYDDVKGNFVIDTKKRILTLIGWRKRTNSQKKLVFFILAMKKKFVTLKMTKDDKVVEKSGKPFSFYSNKNVIWN